jgi:hypothetical protein
VGEPQEPREAWSEVGRRFSELGRALGEHFSRPDAATWQARPSAGADGQAADQRQAVLDAVHRVREAAQQLGDQAGEAVRDPELRETAQRAARGLADAVELTFGQLAGQLRARTGGPGTPPGDTWGPATASSAETAGTAGGPGDGAGDVSAAAPELTGTEPDAAPGDDPDTGRSPARPPSDS